MGRHGSGSAIRALQDVIERLVDLAAISELVAEELPAPNQSGPGSAELLGQSDDDALRAT